MSRVRYDIGSARALLWLVTAGRSASIRPEAHLYMAERYARLALRYENEGSLKRAARLRRKAERHYRMGEPEGPPPAAALAMPIPRAPTFSEARGDDPLDPDGAT